MIKAHEKQLDLRLPRIGVIRKGGEMTRGAKPSDTRPGRDLEYFRLDRAETAVVAAWHEALGDQPKAISGILPYADPAECLSIWDELWNGKRLMWRGDGERLHVKLDGDAYVRYAPGEGPAQPLAAGEKVGKDKVTRNSRLRLLLPQLRIAGIFEVMSSSSIDADELWANLMWIKSTVATLQGAPVTVFRSGRQFNIPNPKGEGTMAVTKYMLHLMLDGRYLDALLPSPVAGLLPSAQAAPSLLAGDIVDDAPDVDDGEYEDAPPVDLVATQPVKKAPAAPAPAVSTVDEDVAAATAAEFIGLTATLLEITEAAVKERMTALGYHKIPGQPEERVKLFHAVHDAAVPAQGDGRLGAVISPSEIGRGGASYDDNLWKR